MKYSEFEQLIKNSGMSEYEQAIFFEQKVTSWYLQNEPRFKSQIAKIWNFLDSPYCWGPDCGIDSITKNYDSTVSAVQSKFYNKKYAVKKSDIDSFFSESGRPIIDSLILFLNTNNIGVNARRMIENYGKPVTVISRKDLEKFDWPDNLEFFNPPNLQPAPEWEHQVRAIEDCEKKLKEVKSVQLYSPCGTGKTREAVGLIERKFKQFKEISDSKENFIAALFEPSRTLISQNSQKLSKDFSIPHRQIGVCSSKDVFSYDEAHLSSSELNIPIVTSDYRRLAEILMQPFDGVTVVLLTYHSHHILKQALDLIDPELYIKIFDEAHHIAGFGEGKIFRPVLKIKSKYTVSMTATPRTVTSGVKTLAKNNGQLVVSMDDESLFGPVAHKFSHKQAVEEGIILPTEIVGLVVRDREIEKLLKANRIITINGSKDIDIRALSIAEAIIRFMRESDSRKFLVFLRTIKASKKFADLLSFVNNLLPKEEQLPDFLVQHISGEMNSYKTEYIKNLFKQHKGYAILTNAQYLAEGVDEPSVNGVVFIEPRYSFEQIQQIVGRSCRKDPENPNKTCGYTLISYFVPVKEDLESVLIKSPFDKIRQTIEALSLNDDIVSSQIDEMSIDYGYTNKIVSNKFKSIKWAFPKNFTNREKEIFEATELVMLNNLINDWMFYYGKLKLYSEKEGHSFPPINFELDGVKLGQWTSRQRCNKEKLSEEKKKLLEILPNWIWDTYDEAWEKAYILLKEFSEKEGHALVPHEYRVNGFKLGAWVGKQRLLKKQNRLSPEKEYLLENFPGWIWEILEEKWNKAFSYLIEYEKKYGNCQVPPSYQIHGFKLGIWVRNQRRLHVKNRMPQEKINKFESLSGWTWSSKRWEMSWSQSFALLKEFADIHNHVNVPNNYLIDDYNLYSWLVEQRNNYDKLSDSQKTMLESLPNWTWNSNKAVQWNNSFNILLQYVEEFGTALVSTVYVVDGFKLGAWVANQRLLKDTMPEERKEKFESLPNWSWSPTADAWEKAFSILLQYVNEHGHARVPQKYIINDFKLGEWVSNQRGNRDTIKEEYKTRLENLPGWVWNVYLSKV